MLQSPQLGTGHAVKMCVEALRRADPAGTGTLDVTGDSPLVQAQSLQKLLDERARTRAACTWVRPRSDPHGMGPDRNSQGEFLGIVEERDATPGSDRLPGEFELLCLRHGHLLWSLDRLTSDNQRGECHTDCTACCWRPGRRSRLPVLQPRETLSINTPEGSPRWKRPSLRPDPPRRWPCRDAALRDAGPAATLPCRWPDVFAIPRNAGRRRRLLPGKVFRIWY